MKRGGSRRAAARAGKPAREGRKPRAGGPAARPPFAGTPFARKATAPERVRLRGERRRPKLLVITGLSGSGKTHVSRALEDAGWFCVDNLPTALLPSFAELVRRSPELRHTAIVVDLRERGFTVAFPDAYRALRREPRLATSLVFLEADDRTLLRRFSETRRPHPLAGREPAALGIRTEREAMRGVRRLADAILDTSRFTVHELRDYVRERYDTRSEARRMLVSVVSFGYKYGLPPEADLVFDARFLANPNFVPALRRLTGNDPAVVTYLRRKPDTARFLKRVLELVSFVLPRHESEGRSYLTLAVGCTGGRHRSVMLANQVGAAVRREGFPVRVEHRDVRQE